MQTDYIPRKDAAFFMFQKVLSETCQANLAAWNISAAAFNKLQTARTPYETAYQNKTNPATRTSTDVITHRTQRVSYTRVLRTFVKEQIAGNTLISNSARTGMSLKHIDSKKSRRPIIDASPMVKAITMNGGWISMDVRIATDSSRSSMYPLADAIEVKYIIATVPPVSPGDCTQTFISTKAKFIIKLDVADAGKKIFGYARYKNIRNDNKSGPWSALFRCMIAD
ncbi:MAG: hypothetical protein ACHQNT_08315 [Bacteroidia bacterium]